MPLKKLDLDCAVPMMMIIECSQKAVEQVCNAHQCCDLVGHRGVSVLAERISLAEARGRVLDQVERSQLAERHQQLLDLREKVGAQHSACAMAAGSATGLQTIGNRHGELMLNARDGQCSVR